MKLYTHPDNVEWLRRHCVESQGSLDPFASIDIFANPVMERDRPTGRYILPDGKAVPREQVRVRDGAFWEWGNSDVEIKYLLLWGMIREERERLFLKVDDRFLVKFFDPLPMFTGPDVRVIYSW